MIALLSGLLIAAGCTASPGGKPISSSNSGGSSSAESAMEGNSVFVSALGSDTNSGLLKALPLLSLQMAIDLAKKSNFTAIYISGDLMLTNLTNDNGVLLESITNVTVSGGWDSNFSARNGESVLNGGQAAATVISILSCRKISLKGLVVTGSLSSSASGGGIAMKDSSDSVINCVVSNNMACYGGGIYVLNGMSNTFSGLIADNTASESGGGIYIDSCAYDTYSCDVISNLSLNECGGISCYNESHHNLFSGDILNNTATGWWVGGIGLVGSTFSNTISGKVCGNTTVQSSGGIYIEGNYNVISGSVISNIAHNDGSGVMFYSGSSNAVASTCVIRYNRCNTGDGSYHGGGICQEDNGQDFILTGAVVTNNYNGSAGTIEDNIYSYYGTF